MSKWLGSVVQICGAVCVSIGSYMLLPAVGWLVAGGFMVVIGVGLEKSRAESGV